MTKPAATTSAFAPGQPVKFKFAKKWIRGVAKRRVALHDVWIIEVGPVDAICPEHLMRRADP